MPLCTNKVVCPASSKPPSMSSDAEKGQEKEKNTPDEENRVNVVRLVIIGLMIITLMILTYCLVYQEKPKAFQQVATPVNVFSTIQVKPRSPKPKVVDTKSKIDRQNQTYDRIIQNGTRVLVAAAVIAIIALSVLYRESLGLSVKNGFSSILQLVIPPSIDPSLFPSHEEEISEAEPKPQSFLFKVARIATFGSLGSLLLIGIVAVSLSLPKDITSVPATGTAVAHVLTVLRWMALGLAVVFVGGGAVYVVGLLTGEYLEAVGIGGLILGCLSVFSASYLRDKWRQLFEKKSPSNDNVQESA